MDEFKENGILILKNAISEDLVKESVQDIWTNILNLPWKEKEKDIWTNIHDQIKNDYWQDISDEIATLGKQYYPMTGSFGALTTPPFFNLATQWKVRQTKKIVNMFRDLYETKDIMVHLDRVSFKFKNQGETEFTHWDSNPFSWPDEKYESIQGMVALSDTSFFAVPKTHTEKFRKKFIKKYPPNNRSDQYYVTKDHDPLKLQEKVIEYKLKRGDMVIWSNRLLHEARKNKTNKMRYAYYVNYFPSGNLSNILEKKYGSYDKFMKDRLESYNTGMNPKYFPSGTSVDLYGRSLLMYYPNKLTDYCNMFKDGWKYYVYKSGKKRGMKIKIPIKWDPRDYGYIPPKLNKRGKKILGIK